MNGPYGSASPLAGHTVPRPVFRRIQEATEPAGPVVTLVDLKTHLRITHSEDDSYLTRLQQTAVNLVQRYIGKRLLSRQVIMFMDYLPGTGNDNSLMGAGVAQLPVSYVMGEWFRWFELQLRPVASFTSFEYITDAGVTVVFDPANYIVDNSDQDQPARIMLQRGSVWPADLRVAKNFKLTYQVGYGADSSTVPNELYHAILLVAAALWSNRGDSLDSNDKVLQLSGIHQILDDHRLRRVGGF